MHAWLSAANRPPEAATAAHSYACEGRKYFFLKKRNKKLLLAAIRIEFALRVNQLAKVFWFFFSKKNRFLYAFFYLKLPDCIFNTPHAAGVVNGHDVEANAGASPMWIFTKQNFRGAGQSCLLAGPQGGGGISQFAPRFYFDEYRKPIAFRNCIDFTGRCAHAAPEYAEAIAG